LSEKSTENSEFNIKKYFFYILGLFMLFGLFYFFYFGDTSTGGNTGGSSQSVNPQIDVSTNDDTPSYRPREMTDHQRRLRRKMRESIKKNFSTNPLGSILDNLSDVGQEGGSSQEGRSPSPTGSDDSSETVTASSSREAVRDKIYEVFNSTRNN